jgi:hypothetical protein
VAVPVVAPPALDSKILNLSRLLDCAARATMIASLACGILAPTLAHAGPNDGTLPGASMPEGDKSTFEYLFDRKSVFTEEKVDTLPPVPGDAGLLPFEVSKQSALTFAIDPKSLSIGKDRVIRYTVVITSTAGARNVRYEGLRCEDGQQWRTYAAADEDGTGWEPDSSTPWEQIEWNSLNAYHAALAKDYFCNFATPNGDAKSIVEAIRYKKTISDQRDR